MSDKASNKLRCSDVRVAISVPYCTLNGHDSGSLPLQVREYAGSEELHIKQGEAL